MELRTRSLLKTQNYVLYGLIVFAVFLTLLAKKYNKSSFWRRLRVSTARAGAKSRDASKHLAMEYLHTAATASGSPLDAG